MGVLTFYKYINPLYVQWMTLRLYSMNKAPLAADQLTIMNKMPNMVFTWAPCGTVHSNSYLPSLVTTLQELGCI
jgi:hypothetical protein